MFLAISRAEFADLEAKLKQAIADHNHEIKSYSPTSDVSGVLITKDVALDFTFDPTFQRLSVNIGKRYSLAAKIAPLQVIENHIIEMLHTLEPASANETVTGTKSDSPLLKSTVVNKEQLGPTAEQKNNNVNGFNIKRLEPAANANTTEPNTPKA